MNINILQGNCIETLQKLDDESINTCITSPPYWGLRNYNDEEKQLGMEDTPEEFVDNLVKVFREVKRVLRDDGTVWLNLGDSYNAGRNGGHAGGSKQNHKKYLQRSGANVVGLKPKDLVGIPWRVALALQQDGWYLRQDIIWHKPNPMPESVKDRCTKAHEYIFLLSKSTKYYFDNEAIKEDLAKSSNVSNKRNKRSVWTITTKPFKGAHFATFPMDLIEPCVLAGCPEGGTVLDPFGGSGTTGIVAVNNKRNAVLCELNQEYIDLAKKRIGEQAGFLATINIIT
tara:strand:- start:93 stop:947 length:855 start_codon:yes stop_codon:yes gene_type:complete